jgi:D-tyrosyl-tRNA(Tyr) deacylase
MRAVLQRVRRGRVSVDGQTVAEIGSGYVILLGVGPGDGEAQARSLAEKIAYLRIFEDEAGKMNRSILEVGGEAIVVSQFTLYADTRKGRRPSFIGAAPPEDARPVVDLLQHCQIGGVTHGLFEYAPDIGTMAGNNLFEVWISRIEVYLHYLTSRD